jgi:hypothetical protein
LNVVEADVQEMHKNDVEFPVAEMFMSLVTRKAEAEKECRRQQKIQKLESKREDVPEPVSKPSKSKRSQRLRRRKDSDVSVDDGTKNVSSPEVTIVEERVQEKLSLLKGAPFTTSPSNGPRSTNPGKDRM